ncbi:MAG: filamentous hemagglutinin N-terminal domain-containing protein [Cyanobacteria bacterium P01_A01_bin.116]
MSSPAQPSFTLAQSITPATDGTGTVVNQTDNNFDITGGTQTGGNLFHSFEQLGLTANETANILSSPDVNNILGRVVGGNTSVIDGLLQVTGSNANLFLVNPAGIIFGPNSQVLVPGAFTATTANGIQLEDAWFNALGSNDYANMFGDPSGFAFTSSDPGAVINGGNISAPGENVTLLGGVVVNTGTIETPGGTINISAVPGANSVEITPEGSLLTLALPAESGLNIPSQGFTASDLPALLSGEAIADTLGVAVEDGVVRLVATDTTIPTGAGTAIASGTLDASDVSENGMGGAIDVLGDRVALSGATLTASGVAGGGSVRIGGDYHGRGTIPNAKQTSVSRDSIVNADATLAGGGGRIIVWADESTLFQGYASAQGGEAIGNGGFVEISGSESLTFDGKVSLLAPNGEAGILLLDPETLTIVDSTAAFTPESNQISWAQIQTQGQSGDVILEATGEIAIADITGAQSGRNNLVILNFVENNSLFIRSTAGNVVFEDTNDKVLGNISNMTIAGDSLSLGSFGEPDLDFTDDAQAFEDRFDSSPDFDFIELVANSGDLNVQNVSSDRIILQSFKGNIQTQALSGDSFDLEDRSVPPVILQAPIGNIVVSTINYIGTVSVGDSRLILSVEAGGTFKATGTSLESLNGDEEDVDTILYEPISIRVRPEAAQIDIQHRGSSFNIGSQPVLSENGNIQYREILSLEPLILGESVSPRIGDSGAVEAFVRDDGEVVESFGDDIGVLTVYENIEPQERSSTESYTEGAIGIVASNGGNAVSYINRTLVGAGTNNIGDGSIVISATEPPTTEPFANNNGDNIFGNGGNNQTLSTNNSENSDSNGSSDINTPNNSDSQNNNDVAANIDGNSENSSNEASNSEDEESLDSNEEDNRELDNDDDTEEDGNGCEFFESEGALDVQGVAPDQCKQ